MKTLAWVVLKSKTLAHKLYKCFRTESQESPILPATLWLLSTNLHLLVWEALPINPNLIPDPNIIGIIKPAQYLPVVYVLFLCESISLCSNSTCLLLKFQTFFSGVHGSAMGPWPMKMETLSIEQQTYEDPYIIRLQSRIPMPCVYLNQCLMILYWLQIFFFSREKLEGVEEKDCCWCWRGSSEPFVKYS